MRRQLIDNEVNSHQIKTSLYKAFRYLLWFYRDITQSPIVGVKFELFGENSSDTHLKCFVISNSGELIEISNDYLKECVVNLFAKKLLNEKSLFFHWKSIEEFEKNIDGKKTKRKQK
jgi:hypothetical protein